VTYTAHRGLHELVVLRCKTSEGGPNSGILIPFGSPLVIH